MLWLTCVCGGENACFKKTRVDQSRICCPCTSMSVSHAFGFLSVSRAQRTIRRRQVKQQTVAKCHREKNRERRRLRQRWLQGITPLFSSVCPSVDGGVFKPFEISEVSFHVTCDREVETADGSFMHENETSECTLNSLRLCTHSPNQFKYGWKCVHVIFFARKLLFLWVRVCPLSQCHDTSHWNVLRKICLWKC